RQRIAIARALATDPRILILDEATSALDYESERVVQANMREIVKDRTVIIIAHRLAAVRRCDRIIGMSDGEVAEAGTHEESLGQAGAFQRALVSLQPDQAEACRGLDAATAAAKAVDPSAINASRHAGGRICA